MLFRRFAYVCGFALLMVQMVVSTGCRTGGTSYQVKWARRGETIAKADAAKETDAKSPPIQQTSASPEDNAAAQIDIGDDEKPQKTSRWGGLFTRTEKPKRLQLPRTDMIEGEEPSPASSTFGEF